ncbi:hypothetical protein H4S08_001551 [Coemansia sp. RSA 1365]|nr:hypothetical protein H4S08_001551 [Coemansia sp. RSA 1365]
MYAQQQQSQQRQTGISHDIVNSDAETNRPSDAAHFGESITADQSTQSVNSYRERADGNAFPFVRIRTSKSSTAQSNTSTSLKQRIRTVPSLGISIPASAQQLAFIPDSSGMVAGTPRTAMSHEASPLTPLEERVFNQSLDTGPRPYNVFDDESVLKICDDEVDQAALAQDTSHNNAAVHGWRIDNVIDKYGNRIASQSKRLARIVTHRKGGSGGNGPTNSTEGVRNQSLLASPVMHAASARRGIHHRTSANGSSSTAGANSMSLSPMPPRTEIADWASPLNRVQDNRMDGLISKARLRMRERSLRSTQARGSHGISQSSNATNSEAMLVADDENANHQSAMAGSRGTEMESLDYGGYSAGCSTSTILHRRGRSGSASSAAAAKMWDKIMNFIMPGGHNRFGMRDERSYKESVGFLLAFALASVAFIMWGTLVPKAVCSTDQTFTADDLLTRRFVAANGIVSDFTLVRSSFGRTMRGYTGYDISDIFPMVGQFSAENYEQLPSSVSSMLSKCVSSRKTVESFIETWMDNSTLYKGDLENFPVVCPFPQAPQTSGAICLVSSWPEFPLNKVGMLKLNKTEVSLRHASPTTSWVIIDDMVYDVSQYVAYASDPIVRNRTVDSNRTLRTENAFLPHSLSQLFIDKPGKDITEDFDNLDIDGVLYKQCMNSLFLRGTTLTTKSPFACANTNVVAWVTFGLYFIVLFFRMATAEIYARLRARKAVLAPTGYDSQLVQLSADNGDDKEYIYDNNDLPQENSDDLNPTTQLPLTNIGSPTNDTSLPVALKQQQQQSALSSNAETDKGRCLEDGNSGSMRKSIGGLAKCLIVVPCFQENIETLTRTLQGIARSAHADSHQMLWIINDGDSEVLANTIRILAHSGRISDPKFYAAYSVDSGSSSYGSARVYAGYYECGRHRIPYVLTAKETYQGGVDSLMMVLSFFRSLSGGMRQQQDAQTQTIFLEEEVEARMTLLGHPPTSIDYCLLIDACVQIDPLAITQFVARMEDNADIIALSGTLYPAGRPSSLMQILQFYEFHLQHFVSPICESLSNVTCPLNQLFTMYRVRLESGERCLGDDDLLASMDALMKRSVRYRHRTWPANDCLLVPHMVRRFQQCRWSFEPNCRAEVELTTHFMAAFDPYKRQWFRTRLVTLFDILRGRMLKRTLPIILGHLLFPFVVPAASCMLYLEIVISMFGDSPAIVVSELTAAFLAATVLLLLVSRRWQLAIYFLIYSAIAVPFFYIWIPVTSFFSMNRIWYSPEQIAAQAATAEAQIQPPENFEEFKNNYKRRFTSPQRQPGQHRRSISSLSSSGEPGNRNARIRINTNPDASSDSEPDILEKPSDSSRRAKPQPAANGLITGLGLRIPSPTSTRDGSSLVLQHQKQEQQAINLAKVVVSDVLVTDAREILRHSLQDRLQRVEPESAEFYSLCERALSILIMRYPTSTVAELAVAVNRAVDEVLDQSSVQTVAQAPVSALPRVESASTNTRLPKRHIPTTDYSVPPPPPPQQQQQPKIAAPIGGIHHPALPHTHPPTLTNTFARQGSSYPGKGRPVSVIIEESDTEQQ